MTLRFCPAALVAVLAVLHGTGGVALPLERHGIIFKAGAPQQAGTFLLNPEQTLAAEVNGAPCLNLQPDTNPYETMKYRFRLDASILAKPGRFALCIVFADKGAGVITPRLLVDDGFNGTYAGPSRMCSHTRLNTGDTRQAWFEFDLPPNLPAESAHPHLTVEGLQHLLEIRLGPPLSDADWDAVKQSIPQSVIPMVTLNRPMELVTTTGVPVMDGGGTDLNAALDGMADMAPLARVLGFTAVESYVLWRRLEPAKEGTFDFSFYDAVVERLQQYGLKWFPLLIVGSSYALPDWFQKSPENVGFVCLEHGLANDIQSIWSPHHKRHVSRVLKAFGDHYNGKGVLEAVRLGPSGNFGESQYPAGGNWGFHGEKMHIHIGWWAGDAFARADFQEWLKRKYGTVAALNQAWDGASFRNIDEIGVALPQLVMSRRQRLDITAWYTDSMSEWCDWWAREAKKHLSGTPLYQSAGGWGFREAGTDYPAQTKTMAELGGGIRLTNETDSYEQNFYATRLAMTSARLYGARIGNEPASSHTPRGVAGRLFGLLTANGDHFFTYQGNIFNHPLGIDLWLENLPVMDTRQPPLVEVAVYYPETMNQLEDGAFRHLYAWGFNPRARDIRRVVEVDYLDETLLRDGFLDKYKALVCAWGNIVEKDVLAIMDKWMRAGGVIIFPSYPRSDYETVEGDRTVTQRWAKGDTGAGRYHSFTGDLESEEMYADFVGGVLKGVEGLHPWTKAAIAAERPEEVFLSIQADGHLLALNYRGADTVLKVPGLDPVTLRPWRIERIALP